VAELGALESVLVVGSFLTKDHPLLAHRLRQAAKRGARIHVLHSVDDDWLMKIASKTIVAPSEIPGAVASFKEKVQVVLLGNFAQQHPQAAQIHAAAQALGSRVGFLGEAANSVGGYLAGLPTQGNLHTVLEKKNLLLLNVEPELDSADPQAARAALERADFVVSLSAYKSGLEHADVLLPIAPFTETAGTFVSTEGRVQSFYASVNPLGEARPGWKVLRVLGSLLGRRGFDFESIDDVRKACLAGRDLPSELNNGLEGHYTRPSEKPQGIQRIAEVPIYFADPLVRRSPPLQKTRDAQPPKAWMNARLMQKLGVGAGQPVLVGGNARLAAALQETLPDDCVRVAAAHASTAQLGPMFGLLSVEKLTVERAA
jgi:NADH-quinone oxidoreductase subunit G